jgi:uncharacterized protein (DUF2237 family)
MHTLNVLGSALLPCSYDPLTGYLRDGCCRTDESDSGSHLICTRVTAEFLEFQRALLALEAERQHSNAMLKQSHQLRRSYGTPAPSPSLWEHFT